MPEYLIIPNVTPILWTPSNEVSILNVFPPITHCLLTLSLFLLYYPHQGTILPSFTMSLPTTFTYTTVTGYFLQDDNATVAENFDFVISPSSL